MSKKSSIVWSKKVASIALNCGIPKLCSHLTPKVVVFTKGWLGHFVHTWEGRRFGFLCESHNTMHFICEKLEKDGEVTNFVEGVAKEHFYTRQPTTTQCISLAVLAHVEFRSSSQPVNFLSMQDESMNFIKVKSRCSKNAWTHRRKWLWSAKLMGSSEHSLHNYRLSNYFQELNALGGIPKFANATLIFSQLLLVVMSAVVVFPDSCLRIWRLIPMM